MQQGSKYTTLEGSKNGKFPTCKILMRDTFQRQTNHHNMMIVFVFLLQKSFNAHDALEDVVSLRNYILSYGLTFDKNNTVKNYCLVHAAEDLVYNIQITAIFQKF